VFNMLRASSPTNLASAYNKRCIMIVADLASLRV
jgi:hypothetical protein